MRYLTLALLLAGLVVLASIIAGHLNVLHPALDSVSHFRLVFDAIGLVIALLLALSGMRLSAAALGVISALSLTVTALPAIHGGQAQAGAVSGPVFRLMQANLRFDNQTPEAFIRILAAEKPDVVIVEEISAMWAQRLNTITGAYPYQRVCPGLDEIGGVAILSRRPFAANGPAYCTHDGALAVDTVDFGGQTVLVAAMHLEWPWPKKQPQQLVKMQGDFSAIANSRLPTLIGGDMNAAPWSAAVLSIGAQTNTKPMAQAWGTWLHIALPNALAPWIGLPIDNFLVSPGVTIHSARTLGYHGSDHRPVLIEFTLPAAGAASVQS